MSMTFDVIIHDYDVRRIFRDLGRAISGPSLAVFLKDDVSDFFRNDIRDRFNEEGDVNSGFWPPLSDATLNIKRELGAPDDINIRSGDLFEFMTGEYEVDQGPNFAKLDIPGGTSDPTLEKKLDTAQRGSNNNPMGFGPTPARPVLATNEMQLAHVLGMLEIHIIEVLVGSMLT